MIAARNNLRTLAEYQQRRSACRDCALFCMCFPESRSGEAVHKRDEPNLRQRLLHKGEHLVLDGQRLSSLYVVRSGSLKTYDLSSDGDALVTGFYFPGEVVGVDGLHSEKHSGHVVALENTRYCEIPLKTFNQLQKKRVELQQLTQRLLCESILATRKLLLTTRHLSAQARLANFLIDIADRLENKDDPGAKFQLSIDRHDIANYLGLTIGTVSRGFSSFRRDGLLTVSGKNVRLENQRALLSIATNIAEREKAVRH